MSAQEITCFDCEGFGKIALAFHSHKLDCRRCQGTGKCPSIMDQWHAAGQSLRVARIARVIGLREDAKRRGMSSRLLSDIERGMIDPSAFTP